VEVANFENDGEGKRKLLMAIENFDKELRASHATML
jgi:hypothetical protein